MRWRHGEATAEREKNATLCVFLFVWGFFFWKDTEERSYEAKRKREAGAAAHAPQSAGAPASSCSIWTPEASVTLGAKPAGKDETAQEPCRVFCFFFRYFKRRQIQRRSPNQRSLNMRQAQWRFRCLRNQPFVMSQKPAVLSEQAGGATHEFPGKKREA